MTSNLDRYNNDLDKLLTTGSRLLIGLLEENRNELSQEALNQLKTMQKRQKSLSFKGHYEEWYSESLQVIRQILPHRLKDYSELYKREKRKDIDYETYGLADYMIGLVITRGWEKEKVFDPFAAAFAKFQQQFLILQSAQQRFESSLFDIKQVVQADLFDSELDSSKELLRSGFSRAAGALAGVVLEKHLNQVCSNHNLTIAKNNPTISVLNDALKNGEVIQTPDWRFIQHLGDLRNLCDHDKKQKPSPDQVNDLINGVEKIIKTLF